jgi:excinuclease UvrABC nuclease subunit
MNAMWRPNLSEIPERPGVYLFRNAKGAILYVGKALNLRRRLASYFHARRRQPPKLRRMIARARAVTIHETDSELQALLLESRLIKQETPPYNQLSTAYHALPFVKLTLSEPFPRLLLTREFRRDGSQYLGPFPGMDIAAVVWAALQRLFPLRTCETSIQPGVFPQPCEAFQVRKCAAPCVGPIAASAYHDHVNELVALLARGHGAIIKRLREERQRAADALFFERARHLHALLVALDEATVGRPLALMPVALRNIVVIFERAHPHTQEMICVRHGLFAGRFVRGGRLADRQALETFLSRCYAAADHTLQPAEAVVDELRIVASWLHRTRARALWVYLDAGMNATAAGEAVMHALPESRRHPP